MPTKNNSWRLAVPIVSALVLFSALAYSGDTSDKATSATDNGDVDERSAKICRRQYESRQPERALKNCINAARSGDVQSYLILGLIYRGGLSTAGTRGRQKYPELAYKSFLKAAELGNAQAHYLVGEMLEIGEGVAVDGVEAESWKNKARELGYWQKSAQ